MNISRTFLLIALLISAAAPATVEGQNRRVRDEDYDQDYQSRIDTTLAFDRRGTVTLSIGSGEIIVRTWNRDQIQVRARSERSVVRMEATPTRMALDLSRPRGGDTRFEVTVPVGARISARATNGDISVNGAKGGVEARTQSGDVNVEDVGDMIDLGSLSGDITGRGLVGSVDVSAISGDVDLTDVKGDVAKDIFA